MKSPAQRHRERLSAAQAASSDNTLIGTRSYELMRTKLATDRQRLKAIQSLMRKAEVKREILPDYADYITGALEGGHGAQDDVLMTVMVWRIDAGDVTGALDIADYALRHRLTLPDPYQRTVATLLTEDIAEAALANLETFPLDTLQRLADLISAHDMPDPVRAKLHKALGYALQERDPEMALIHLRRALALHERCGVKKDIDRLERLLVQAVTSTLTEPPGRAAQAEDR